MQLTDAVQFLPCFDINAEQPITPDADHDLVFPARINLYIHLYLRCSGKKIQKRYTGDRKQCE